MLPNSISVRQEYASGRAHSPLFGAASKQLADCLYPLPSRSGQGFRVLGACHRLFTGCALLAAALISIPLNAAAPAAFSIRNPTIVAGGGVVVSGNLRLSFTIGEAVAGPVSAGGWNLVAGFPPTIPTPPPLSESIFANGFE